MVRLRYFARNFNDQVVDEKKLIVPLEKDLGEM